MLLLEAGTRFSDLFFSGRGMGKVPMGKVMPLLTHFTGNGKHTTYKNGDDWGMVYGIVLLTLYIYTFNPVFFCCQCPQ